MKKHGVVWWLCIGWWWYLCFAWWLYPIKRLLFGKSRKDVPGSGADDSYWLLRKTEEAVLDFLKKSEGGTALQVDVKASLSKQMLSCFDEAVQELYQNGAIKTFKDGSRVRLELVGR